MSLWAQENLHAWLVVPYDARRRGPEERAALLRKLGFQRFAYDGRGRDLATFDAEIRALKAHGVEPLAWWFGDADASDPFVRESLKLFARHDVRPRLWVMQSVTTLVSEVPVLLPDGVSLPLTEEQEEALPDDVRARLYDVFARWRAEELTSTPEEQGARVRQTADRIEGLVKLAAGYGCGVDLYNHNGWFGMLDNQLAIIEELGARGVTGVGIAYNFNHVRDELHDDTVDFPALWSRIQQHVTAVNVSGTYWERTIVYPSQGDCELAMLGTIERSGWRGPIGLIAEQGGDAEATLSNAQRGLQWLATELRQPGSGGPRPFPERPRTVNHMSGRDTT